MMLRIISVKICCGENSRGYVESFQFPCTFPSSLCGFSLKRDASISWQLPNRKRLDTIVNFCLPKGKAVACLHLLLLLLSHVLEKNLFRKSGNQKKLYLNNPHITKLYHLLVAFRKHRYYFWSKHLLFKKPILFNYTPNKRVMICIFTSPFRYGRVILFRKITHL
jgi:hypothetical protein